MAADHAQGYEDIIDLPHHQSARHPQMPLQNRAAQFAPFAALTGHDEAIRETARLTDRRVELDEYEKQELDRKLRLVLQQPCAQEVTITWFVPDAKKEGGAYAQTTGAVKKLDRAENALVLTDGRRIPVEDIFDVQLHPGQGEETTV